MNRQILSCSILALATGWICACGSDDAGPAYGQGGSAAGGSGGATGASGSGHAGAPPSTTCASDPLRTGLVAQQTGVSVDSFDCEILKYTAQYNEPDAMIFKAIIYVESRFNYTAVGCPNTCGTPPGWTPDECGCCGLMQSLAPACPEDRNKVTFLPNGHPDMATDPSSPDWPGSVFNPDVNIKFGVQGIAGNRAAAQKQFPGCTEEQYTLMAIGNFNHYGSTKSCTQYNTDYDNAVLAAYHQYSAAARYPEHPYP